MGLDKVLEKVKSTVEVKGYVLYFFDTKNLEAEWKVLYELPITIRIKSTKETFNIEKPAFYNNGKPVFICVRGNPNSVSLEFLENKLIEKGYTSAEIDAKIHSIYVNRIFRRTFLNKDSIILLILSNIISILVTSMYFMVKYAIK